MLQTVLIDTHDIPCEILVCVHDKPRAETEICPGRCKIWLKVQIFLLRWNCKKIIQSKVVWLPAAIESWKASFFVRNICTHAGWREGVAIWMCKLPAPIQAEAKEFEFAMIVCNYSVSHWLID